MRGTTAVSRLARLLHEGHFVVTAELASSDSPDPAATWRRAAVLRGSVDAINGTDNTTAHDAGLLPRPTLSPLATVGGTV